MDIPIGIIPPKVPVKFYCDYTTTSVYDIFTSMFKTFIENNEIQIENYARQYYCIIKIITPSKCPYNIIYIKCQPEQNMDCSLYNDNPIFEISLYDGEKRSWTNDVECCSNDINLVNGYYSMLRIIHSLIHKSQDLKICDDRDDLDDNDDLDDIL
jgi:hypothetical protein